MSSPRVSICIPTYNRASMVSVAIESALNQTYKNIEVVVVDNASTDDIWDVVSQYNDTRLYFVKNKENLGIFGNFNRCIEVSRGDFIHILHSDDFIDPTFTETCVKFFDEHPNVALTFTSKIIHSPDKDVKVLFAERDQLIPKSEGFRRLLRDGNYINCPSVMARKKIYDTIGNYSLEYPYAGDYYQWLKITRTFEIAHISNIYVHYRVGEHNESFQFLGKNPVGYLDILKIIVQTIHDLGDDIHFFIDDINMFLTNYYFSFLMSGFQWADREKRFDSFFFIGLALTSWALIRPQSLRKSVGKLLHLLVILGSGLLFSISPVRVMISKVIARKRKCPGFNL